MSSGLMGFFEHQPHAGAVEKREVAEIDRVSAASACWHRSFRAIDVADCQSQSGRYGRG